MRPLTVKWVIVAVAVIVLAYTGSTYATKYCCDLDGRPIGVGEARYLVFPSDDECYANAYWDNEDELSLSGIVGGTTNSIESDLNFRATAHMYDIIVGDCADVTIQMVQKRSNTESDLCPSSFTSITDTVLMSSCSYTGGNGNTDQFYTPTRVGRGGQVFKRYWQWDLSVETGTGCTDSDSGCAIVLDETECTLYNDCV